ncbi:NAD-dependent dehydratase [Vagococcus zengguangii]|uniref:NAD-dependent dehydratase n=1 Tax=Vagococcus zengguangii TaxID=2571750 RepID=UPI0011088961|nr:NAD-dependent dehydratase [Vagococcus zengguangii]TLG79820.1 NAD-dependent dehydratase [Vagococcus zengguangii]
MKKMLIFGGTRFLGKKTALHFIDLGYEVTIATRGKSCDDLGDKVKRLIIDRTDSNHPGWEVVASENWDVIFDNIAYDWQSLALSLEKVKNVGHYLFTSSMAVYEGDKGAIGFKENDFDPTTYDYDSQQTDVSYGEGKRQGEAYLTKHAPFPVTFLRFPIVLDTDDYTERLKFYIEHALNHQTIIFKRQAGWYGFVHASEIPLAIEHVLEQHITGPINIASTEPYHFEKFLEILANTTEQSLEYEIDSQQAPSPFSHYDTILNVDRLMASGFKPSIQDSWLPDTMRYYVQNR